MTQHTPGPWRFEPTQHTDEAAKIGGLWYIEDARDDYEVIAVLPRVHEKPGEAKANARLIAAAPEMLSLLRQILEDAWHEGPINDVLRNIRALLAKIKGKDKP